MRPLLLSLLALAAVAAEAQITLGVSAGASRAQFDAERVDRFDETYSAYYAQRLDGDVDLLPDAVDLLTLGARMDVPLGGLSFGVDYAYGWGSRDAASVFENGSGDRVTLDVTEHVVGTDMLFYPVEQLGVGAVVTGTFRGLRLTSRSVYADGSESLGGEYRLNGVYRASPSSLEIGGVARVHLGPLAVRGRYAVPLPLSSAVSLPLTDYDLEQLNNGFPRDWDRWLADATGSDEGAQLQDTDFQGPRIDIALEYTF